MDWRPILRFFPLLHLHVLAYRLTALIPMLMMKTIPWVEQDRNYSRHAQLGIAYQFLLLLRGYRLGLLVHCSTS